MHRRWTLILALILSVAVIGCADDTLSPISTSAPNEPPNAGAVVSEQQAYPTFLTKRGISSIEETAAIGVTKRAHGADGNGFATPLFGLTTAPNGDALVADAGAGIATVSGATDIPLLGVTDMSPLGRRSLWALQGLTGDPGEDTGQALYRAAKGQNRLIADLYAFENEVNPDGKPLIDSNPFDVQSLGGEAALVADAGGNDLLRVDNRGNIEVLAVFPDELASTGNIKGLFGCPEGLPTICGLPPEIPTQAVPTSVAIGPDGYYYVGELKGFPAPTGASNIWKIAPDASWAQCGSSPDCQKVFDGGFTSIIDLAFDAEGNLHVTELDEQSWFALELLAPGDLVGGTINNCDLSTTSCSTVATGIPILTAITFGKDGTLWATKNALIPGAAEVIQIE